MRGMRQLVAFDPAAKTVRVQAGMRWRELQAVIDPHGLAVRTMQSYANFTVGGSVSVNCYGRYLGHGLIVSSVCTLQLVMPDGEILEVSREREAELFFAAIGGYGGVGVITEVELALDDNFAIARSSSQVPLADYAAWFKQTVAADPTALLHNADLLRPAQARYATEQAAIWAMSELPAGPALRRRLVQHKEKQPAVTWPNSNP